MMVPSRYSKAFICAATLLSALLCEGLSAHADPQFTSSFLDDANTWPGSETDVGIYAQGFRPSLDASPDPGHADTDLVGLDRFTFYKDGYTDAASDIKLAIVNNIWLELSALTTSSAEFVGISTNSIASTAGLSADDPYTFEFSSLQLEYGADYGAIFVNDDGLGNLTPVKVSALTADYAETSEGSGVWLPVSNYGTETDYQYSTSSYIDSGTFGDYLVGFSDGGDAKFEAIFDYAGIDGDLDGDGDVDIADLMIWQREDGSAAGLALWQDNFAAGSTSAAAVAVVPEPAAALLVWLAACGLIAARRRGRARQ